MTLASDSLPALASNTDINSIIARGNVLIRDYNREDTFAPIFALDTGSATAYAIAPIPGIEQYVVGQIFVFKAANANSGTTPTLNVNSVGAGTIKLPGGGAVAAGDIVANGFTEVVVTATTPTFELLSGRTAIPSIPIANTGATTFLAADVTGISSTFVNGPNTGSIGANGQVWLIHATALMWDTAGAALLEASIYNGTSNIVSGHNRAAVATEGVQISLCIVVTLTGATTFTLQGKDQTSANGVMLTTGATTGGANNATSITAVRLA